jgi:glutaredoxin
MRAYLTVAAILWIACSDAAGQTYRWVDDQGRVHYTQTPPPPSAKGVQRKDFRSGGGAEVGDLPYATQVAAKNFPVKLYTQPDCGPPCDRARATLVKRGVPFREISVVGQKELDEMTKLSGKEDLPLVVVGSQFQSGFREDALNGLLDTAGYPTTASPRPADAPRKAEPAPAPVAPRVGGQRESNY